MVNEHRFTGNNRLNFQLAKNWYDFSKSACHIWIDHNKTYRYMPNLHGKTSFFNRHIWHLTSKQNTRFLRGVTHSAPYGGTFYETWGIHFCGTWHQCVPARFCPRNLWRLMIWPMIYRLVSPQLVNQWSSHLSHHCRDSSSTTCKNFKNIGPLVREILRVPSIFSF